MNENEELLTYIYQTSNMGLQSMVDLLNCLKGKDNKIMDLLFEIKKNYEKYVLETEKLLKKHKLQVKDLGLMTKTMSKLSIGKEMIEDNSDANIADMLIKGLTMGNLELTKSIQKYENVADKKIISLARDLLKFGENYIEKLKMYL